MLNERHSILFALIAGAALMLPLHGAAADCNAAAQAGSGEKVGLTGNLPAGPKTVPPGLPPGTRVVSDISGGCLSVGDTGTIDCFDPLDPVLPYRVVWDNGCGIDQCWDTCDPRCSVSFWHGFDDLSEIGGGNVWPSEAYARVQVQGEGLDTLRAYRDQVITSNAAGVDVVTGFYDNGFEVATRILTDKVLAARTALFVKDLTGEVRAVVDGGTGVLYAAMQARAHALLDAYGAGATPALQAVIAEVKAILADEALMADFGFMLE